ncbi:Lrp/AsnC family transcriptional regulator [Rhizobiales bacterium]|uniref:siroheme decarboxylase subunit beta n=1 Tax=Hongsoonwoonella zoysiae TaxID=2821844 RepID=UPI0015617B6A|nr:Lrp/AsnC family transcriptional regulator [Hongsoonwoonella zoysiae]NRG18214.1 Lrp/AsnC family transcriptional regulator [Hongsoonwoonella zoysiae]
MPTGLDQETQQESRAIDLALLDRWQHDFPLVPHPFQVIAGELDLREREVLERFRTLQANNAISRIGAVLAPNTVGASTLAAVCVEKADIAEAVRLINMEPGVNHNYERDHKVNLWFVVTAADEAALDVSLERISSRLGKDVLDLRLERPFHLDLGFSIEGRPEDSLVKRRLRPADASAIEPEDREVLAALQDGLPFVFRPFYEIGRRAGRSEADVLARLARLSQAGVIRRFGVVVKHRTLGFGANAMVVFDIADDDVDAVGERLSHVPGVTLCYRRRRATGWPFNLYCMVHARSRAQAEPVIERVKRLTGLTRRDMAVLFSTKCFRQRGPLLCADRTGNGS